MKKTRRSRLWFLLVITVLIVLQVNMGNTYAAPAVCPSDMTSYWKLDEISGPPYQDSVGLNDASCTGINCPDLVAGQLATGLQFDGVTDRLNVPADASFNWSNTESFSIEFWMKTAPESTCEGKQVIVGRDDSVARLHWWVGCRNRGEAQFCLYDTNGVTACIIGTTDLTDGNWHHVAAVRDAFAGDIRIYADGALENSLPVQYTGAFGSATVPLNIGWINIAGVGYAFFAGSVDEIALHAGALSDETIKQHYDDGASGPGLGYCGYGQLAPSITSAAVTEGYAGLTYTYQVEAAGNPFPAFSLLIGPAGMTINPATGLITWTPSSAGNVNVSVRASNSQGNDTQSYLLQVADAPPCPSGMTHFWKFDETSGATYADFYGVSDARCTDCPSAVAGHIGGAQQFDSSTEVKVIADAEFGWEATDSFSIEFWMKTAAASTCAGNQVILGRDDSITKLHWWVGCQAGGQPEFCLYDKLGVKACVSGITDLTDGNWHHVAAVRDGSKQEIRIYADGVLAGTKIKSYTSNFKSKFPLNVGWLSINGEGFSHFVGAIDDLAVYNKALSDTEVWQHFTFGEAYADYCTAVEPMIYSVPEYTAGIGKKYTYNADALGNPAPTFSLDTKPAGMTIDAATGLVTWTPKLSQAGIFPVVVRATNSAGFDTQSFTIDVSSVSTEVILISPNGGEVVPTGQDWLIEWTAPVSATSFKLKYSLDNGATWVLIPQEPARLVGTTYLWPVPARMKNKNCLVKVVGFAGETRLNADTSDSVFTIDAVSITTPSAGNTVTGSQSILWKTNSVLGTVDRVKLLYSKDRGVTWTLIGKTAAGTGDPGSYLWENIPALGQTKDKSRIKLVLFDSSGKVIGTALSGFFKIQ